MAEETKTALISAIEVVEIDEDTFGIAVKLAPFATREEADTFRRMIREPVLAAAAAALEILNGGKFSVTPATPPDGENLQ